MKILITGAKGFIGRNLVAELSRFEGSYELFGADIDTPATLFQEYIKCCDFVVHLAGVNRPKTEDEFETGNANFTEYVVSELEKRETKVPILITSSIQSDLSNAYGISKRAAEKAVFDYGKKNDVDVFVFKLPNVFGKWCRPNYNSAVATFCHNIANDLPIQVNDPKRVMELIYIDDLLKLIKSAISREVQKDNEGYVLLPVTYKRELGKISDTLYAFHASKKSLVMPQFSDGLDKALYSTYLSYFTKQLVKYPLDMKGDERGIFAEFFKTNSNGQFSVSTTAPGITRGNHWHHTKVEKFLVVKGEALIKFRKLDDNTVFEVEVSGEKLEMVDIPAGFTHSITNISKDQELVLIIWANELFDEQNPDTYFLEV